MQTIVITKKELHVPVGIMLDVADLLLENEIANDIVGTDADEETIIIEVQFEKEQRDIIHEVEDTIADFLQEMPG